ncbi:MAG: hypothetical protein JO260_07040 [Acidobacteria bacterium]|nr:hypothetical protein [Acidobacteriota bacterium]
MPPCVFDFRPAESRSGGAPVHVHTTSDRLGNLRAKRHHAALRQHPLRLLHFRKRSSLPPPSRRPISPSSSRNPSTARSTPSRSTCKTSPSPAPYTTSIVGGNTAFVGFTAGTGGLTATQEILTWTYSNSGGTTGTTKTPVVYQTANLPAVSSGPTFRTFTYASFPDTTGTILDATAAGQSVTMTVNVATAGTYDIKISTKLLSRRGVYQLSINGANVGSLEDEYNSSSAGVYATQDLGNFNFAAAGSYSFQFTVMGKNAASTGYSITFDDITLTPQ